MLKIGDRVRVYQDASLAFGGCEGTIVEIPHEPLNGPSVYEYGVALDERHGHGTASRGFQGEELLPLPDHPRAELATGGRVSGGDEVPVFADDSYVLNREQERRLSVYGRLPGIPDSAVEPGDYLPGGKHYR